MWLLSEGSFMGNKVDLCSESRSKNYLLFIILSTFQNKRVQVIQLIISNKGKNISYHTT